MAAEFDESDFIDTDFQLSRKSAGSATAAVPAAAVPGPAPAASARPPGPQELATRVHETQQRLEELKRAQEQLEQERAALEEARRRRSEYHTGREEMLEHLTRGIGLLEQAEFSARREAEQMAKVLGDLRDHLVHVQGLDDQAWTQENYASELTRALTALENARLEWNGAQLKFPFLGNGPAAPQPQVPTLADALAGMSFGRLCRLGLALTWPLVLVAVAAAVLFALALFQR